MNKNTKIGTLKSIISLLIIIDLIILEKYIEKHNNKIIPIIKNISGNKKNVI